MKQTSKLLLFIIILLLANNLWAQADDELMMYEDSLKSLFAEAFAFDGVKYLKSDEEKVRLNGEIIAMFQRALLLKNSFDYPFDSLKSVGNIRSDDKKVRLYTWNLQYGNREFKYFGILHHRNKDNLYITLLNDASADLNRPEYLRLTEDKWYGALYYNIITSKSGSDTFYTLLGWDGNNDLTTKKIIEVLSFSKNQKPVFGDDVFVQDDGNVKRIIFEYSSRVSMLLRYFEEDHRIVFDYLVPVKSIYKDKYQYYGPDGGTYNAYEFIAGKWLYKEEIVLKNKKSQNHNGSLFKPESNDFYLPSGNK